MQPHLKKCFDGIAKLDFSETLDILACMDPGGDPERIEFMYDAVQHTPDGKPINPKDSGGNVEKWLVEVEIMMKKSLAHIIDLSCRDFQNKEKVDWTKDWAGQVVICANQVYWTVYMEEGIREGSVLGPARGSKLTPRACRSSSCRLSKSCAETFRSGCAPRSARSS